VKVVYESNPGRYVVEETNAFGNWVPTQSYDTLAEARKESDLSAKLFITLHRVIDTEGEKLE
jgi:hypothetical protein